MLFGIIIRLYAALPLVCVVVLSGCSTRDELLDRPASVAGAGSLIPAHEFEPIDLVTLLDPDKMGNYDGLDEPDRINKAFRVFVRRYDPETLRQRRNAVQEHILASSNQRCGYYERYLQTIRSHVNFGLGALATAAGAAGAIFTGGTSQALAATSAIFSGTRAEFNQELFANLATHVVSNGIDLRRREVYEQISLQGQSKGYDIYSVEAAIKDAIYYHSQCSLIAGIKAAGESIQLQQDPGIDVANRTLAKLSITKKLLNGDKLTPQEKIGVFTNGMALLRAGTPLGGAGDQDTARDPLKRISNAKNTIKFSSKKFLSSVAALADKIPNEKLTQFKEKVPAAEKAVIGQLNGCVEKADRVSQDLAKKGIELQSAKASGADEQQLISKRTEVGIAGLQAVQVSKEVGRVVKRFNTLILDAESLLKVTDGPSVQQVDRAIVKIEEGAKLLAKC